MIGTLGKKELPRRQKSNTVERLPARCGVVILAAGNSTRFGSDKRQFPLADGRTMLQATLATYQAVFDQVFLVLKPNDAPWGTAPTRAHLTQKRVDDGYRLANVQEVYAQEAALGMGHSLAAGVQAARHLNYLFIALADMPHVQTATLERLRRELTDTRCIVQPEFQSTPGHPVGFGSTYFNELQALTGDVGAKSVLHRHADRVRRVPVQDSGTVHDIDIPPTTNQRGVASDQREDGRRLDT